MRRCPGSPHLVSTRRQPFGQKSSRLRHVGGVSQPGRPLRPPRSAPSPPRPPAPGPRSQPTQTTAGPESSARRLLHPGNPHRRPERGLRSRGALLRQHFAAEPMDPASNSRSPVSRDSRSASSSAASASPVCGRTDAGRRPAGQVVRPVRHAAGRLPRFQPLLATARPRPAPPAAAAQPSRTVAPACQNANRCSTATASGSPTRTRGPPARSPRNWCSMAAKCSASARVLGCDPSPRQPDRLPAPAGRLVRVAQQPQGHRAERQARDAGILAELERQAAVPAGVVQAGGRFHVPARRGRLARAQRHHRPGLARLEDQAGSPGLLRQREQLVGQQVGPAAVPTAPCRTATAPTGSGTAGRLPATRVPQLARPGVRLFHARGREPVGHLELQPEGHLQPELAGRPLRRVRQAARAAPARGGPAPAASRWANTRAAFPAAARNSSAARPKSRPDLVQQAPARPPPAPGWPFWRPAARRPAPRLTAARRAGGSSAYSASWYRTWTNPYRSDSVRSGNSCSRTSRTRPWTRSSVLEPLLDVRRVGPERPGEHRRVELVPLHARPPPAAGGRPRRAGPASAGSARGPTRASPPARPGPPGPAPTAPSAWAITPRSRR